MKAHISISIFILSIVSFFSASASGLSFRKYKVENGLSHNSVWCILQDSCGFIWAGTSDGLNCYNGKDNKIYRNQGHDPFSLENNNVTALLEFSRTNLWIGTNKGIYSYDRHTGHFSYLQLQTRYGVSVSSEVCKMLKGKDGAIWIATLGQGIFRYADKELRQFISDTSFALNLSMDTEGNIYVSTLQNGILVLDGQGKKLQHFPTKGAIYSLICDGAMRWLGTERNTIECMDKEGNNIYVHKINELQTNVVRDLLKDKDGNILIATDNGLYRMNSESKQVERLDNPADIRSLSNSQITALMQDAEGGIWIATNGGGMNYMSRQASLFSYFYPMEGNGKNEVRRGIGPMCEDEKGNLFIGTHHGIYCLEPGQEQFYNLLKGENQRRLYDIRTLWLDQQVLWAGTYGNGIIRVDLKTGASTLYSHNKDQTNTLPSDYVLDLYRDKDNKLYVGTTNGLCWFDERAQEFLLITPIGAMVSVEDIYEDTAHNLWVATSSNGVFRCDKSNNSWRHYQYSREQPSSLSSNNVTTLTEDASGHIWMGTNGGGLCLFHADTETFSRFDKSLPNKVIYAIEQDLIGDFWISTNAGLVRLNPQKPDQYQLFTVNNGLQGNQFNRHSSLRLRDGRLAFGGDNGLNLFSPWLFQQNTFLPPVYVTGISFPYGSDDEIVKRLRSQSNAPKLPDTIVLPYEHNSFTLSFASLSYEDPSQNKYQYYMEGEDKEWVISSGMSTASYTNLSPGTYHFYVKGTNNNGLWNDEKTAITLIITPPWWLSIWAKIAYTSLLIISIAYIAWQWNRYVKKKYLRRMEEYNAAREQETYRQKISFFINLVHEIRTPLSLIRLPLERLMQTNKEPQQEEFLSVIDRNVNYLLNITNQLLDFQKMESGKLSLNLSPCNPTDLTERIYTQFASSARLKGLELSLHVPDEPLQAVIDKDKISKILVNLASNAMKYANSRISITLTATGQGICWQVDDDGPGIPDNAKKKIFEAFYRVSEEETAPAGTGIGLAYSRSLAEAHNGTLSVENNDWGGSRFRLALPLEATAAEEPSQELVQLNEETAPLMQKDDKTFIDKHFTILLVEDNAELLKLTADALGEWFKVKKALNGQQALECLAGESIDVIVSDVMMPVMDGLELCSHVKQNINYSHIPVILLTAKTTLQAKAEGMQCGADAYVEKPFSIHQLQGQIENLLRLRQTFHRQMLQLEGNASAAGPNDATLSQRDYEFTTHLYEIIEAQLCDENFSVDNLAEAMNMSRSNFYRKIKALSGMAPNDYLKVIRLNKAAELLRQGSRISEVYAQVGFSSSSYFAKCFKAQFNVLPKDYAEGVSCPTGF